MENENDINIAGGHADLSYWATTCEDLGNYPEAASLWEEAANVAHRDAAEAMDWLQIREATEFAILEAFCLEQRARCLSMAAELGRAEAEALEAFDLDADADAALQEVDAWAVDVFDS